MTFVTYSQVLSFDTTRTSSLLCFHRSMNWKCPKQQNEEYILTRSEALGPLDYEISEQETVTAIDLLKTGKAPGVDNILCELLKHGKEALKGPLTILFNNILISGRYPTLWSHGLIIPIFKKDDPSNPENYRGITLLSAMGKIFTSIMNSRLCDYLIEKGIITPEQCGFRKKHGTQDSIFILKALIDKYVKSKPKKSNNLLFTCFVNFRDWSRSIRRGGGPEQRGGRSWGSESCARGGSCNFQLPLNFY